MEEDDPWNGCGMEHKRQLDQGLGQQARIAELCFFAGTSNNLDARQ